MKFYAVEMTDILGNKRFWNDSYPNIKLAAQDAKSLKREHPHMTVMILKELPRPVGHTFGAQWKEFRLIK